MTVVLVACFPGSGPLCVSDFYTTMALLPLLVILAAVFTHRAPSVLKPSAAGFSRLQDAKPTKATGGYAVLDGAPWLLCLAEAACSSFIAVGYALLLTDHDSSSEESDAPHAPQLYTVCLLAGAVMWVLSALLVLLEMRVGRHAGRSLRLWWLLNLLVSLPRLVSDAVRCESGVSLSTTILGHA